MTYNFDSVNNFFKDLMNGKNAKFNMLCVYGAYERVCKENKKKQEIEDKFKIAGYYYTVNIINDSIAIVEEQKTGKSTGNFAYVDNMASYCRWPTFEQALLCAISIKLTGREDATEWMIKLLK